jgi:hypothetical protein
MSIIDVLIIIVAFFVGRFFLQRIMGAQNSETRTVDLAPLRYIGFLIVGIGAGMIAGGLLILYDLWPAFIPGPFFFFLPALGGIAGLWLAYKRPTSLR